MARTGRPPLPSNVRRLHGEARPSRTRVEPQPLERAPEPPGWLSEEARGVWDRLVGELEPMGLLFSADADQLAALASSVAAFAEAERALAVEGRVVEDSNGTRRRNPWVLIRRDALTSINRLGSEFGLSPVARAHLAIKPPLSPGDGESAARLLS